MNRNERDVVETGDLRALLELRTEELRSCRERVRALEGLLDEKRRQLEGLDRYRAMDHLLILQSRQAAVAEMIGNVAHQWRQPLTAISLLMQDLRESYLCDELSREHLESNIGNALSMIQQLSMTINDLRDFFRRDKESGVFSVRETLERTVSFIESSLRYHNVAVSIDAEEGLWAKGYANEFSQALLNIICNARNILRERQVKEPEIRIRAFQEDDATVITISDNGGGIPETLINRIFEPEFTPPSAGTGSGLGLYLSKIVIERRMGGRISAANEEGGASFRIEI